MIFVTVGAQMPFDRLIRAVDRWAAANGRTDVVAQIGPTDFEPEHLTFDHHLDPETFRARMREASVIVAHAGMGTILTALEFGKPILVMPRRGALRETRNDHQVATAERLSEQGYVEVAFDEDELPGRLDELAQLPAPDVIRPVASEELLGTIRRFLDAEENERPEPGPNPQPRSSFERS